MPNDFANSFNRSFNPNLLFQLYIQKLEQERQQGLLNQALGNAMTTTYPEQTPYKSQGLGELGQLNLNGKMSGLNPVQPPTLSPVQQQQEFTGLQNPQFMQAIGQMPPETAQLVLGLTMPKYSFLNQEGGGYQVFKEKPGQPPEIVKQQLPFATQKSVPNKIDTQTLIGKDGKPHTIEITRDGLTGQEISRRDLGQSGFPPAAGNQSGVDLSMIPGELSGDELLKALNKIDPRLGRDVQQIRRYKFNLSAFPTRTYRGGMQFTQQQLQGLADQYIPGYDATKFPAVAQMEKDYASTRVGTAGGNIIAFKTAIRHLDKLNKAAEALQNGNVAALNSVANYYKVNVAGQSSPAVFDAIRNIVATEVDKAARGTGVLSEIETRDIKNTLSNALPAQITSDVAAGQIGLMQDKADQLIQHYVNYKGEFPANAYNQEDKNILKKYGKYYWADTQGGTSKIPSDSEIDKMTPEQLKQYLGGK